MVSSLLSSALAVTGLIHSVSAQSRMCHSQSCDDCPVSTTDSGIGFPDCTIYNSADVFNGIFEKSDAGTWDIWLDVPRHENTECTWIVKSPASQGIDTCGQPLWNGPGGECRSLSLKDTFMLQFCCGFGDCCAAGVPNLPNCNNGAGGKKLLHRRDVMSSPVFSMHSNAGRSLVDARSTGGSLKLVDKDGNVIPPAEEGADSKARRAEEVAAPKVRRDVCVKDSWVDDGEEFITTSPNTQVVSETHDGGTEGTTVTITTTRTSSWSTTMEANIGFADIFSMGVSFSVTESESISTSEAATYTIPAGQKGYVAWTAFVICKEGAGECNDGEVKGRVCVPYENSLGGPAGEFHVVQSG